VGDPSELDSRSVSYVRIEVSVCFRRCIAFWRKTRLEFWRRTTLVNYRPIGSGAGLDEFKKTLLGFAASDAPLSDEDLRQMVPVVQIPVTAGPVCAIYNVPGVKRH
jgi:ABC-type phosphate transport system substrate-binding protein